MPSVPAIFVHGVPETTELWGPLVDRIERDDVVLLGLPGFGTSAPAFEPTKDHYASWLAEELRSYDDVDLVAHDWGAILALRVLADRPANVRSWAIDAADIAEDFRWHDLARLWISDEGEGFMAGLLDASESDRAAALVSGGVPADAAPAMARMFDQTMATCILTLYRSATDLGTAWGPGIDEVQGPGLVIEAAGDPFRAADRNQRLATRTGAELAQLPDAAHWWMIDQPDAAAAMLEQFWASVA